MLDDSLMDPTKMTDARTALLCARLNLRVGKRRLQKGLTAAGITALYDSLLFGMRYYVSKHEGCALFVENIELWDAMSLFHALVRAGVFEDPLTFNRFSLTVERALWQKSFSFDVDVFLRETEKMLTQLDIIPLR